MQNKITDTTETSVAMFLGIQLNSTTNYNAGPNKTRFANLDRNLSNNQSFTELSSSYCTPLKKIISNYYKDGTITFVHNTYIVAKELKGF